MFCEKCGKENLDYAAFCADCGAPLNAAKPDDEDVTVRIRPVETVIEPADEKEAVPVEAAAEPEVPAFEEDAPTGELAQEDAPTGELSSEDAPVFDLNTEGVVEDGDTLNIGYVGTVDGVAFNGGSTGPDGTEVTIGVTQYIDDFLAQLIGHEVGENFDIEVTFPENYGNEQLNGKDAIFNITINSIIETKIPELTDEFCAENFAEEFNTVEKFKAQLTEDLSNELINSYLYTNVFTEAEISEVPAVVSDFVKSYILSTYEMQAISYGFTLDDYIAQVGFAGRDEFLGYFQKDIDLFCEDYLIMTAIAEAEGIEITDADVTEYFKKYLGGEDSSIAENIYGKSYLKFTALQNKVLDYLIENTPREQ